MPTTYGANAEITGSLAVDGNIDLGSGDDDVNLDSNTLFVDADQDKVGIGTDSPDYTLDVAGDIGVNQYIYHNGDGNTWINFTDNRIRLNAGGNNFIDCEDPGSAPHKVRINNGGNNIDFVIKDNGNNVYFTADASTSRVGIGTTTPAEALHVAGNIKVAGNDPRIKIDGDTDSHPGLELYENGTRKWIAYNNYTNDNLTFKTNSDVRMVIAQDGNVGIGVGDPDTTLHVIGDVKVSGSDARVKIDANASSDAAVEFYEGGTAKWTIGNESTRDGFHIKNGSGSFSTSNDAVVIGTSGVVQFNESAYLNNGFHLGNESFTSSDNGGNLSITKPLTTISNTGGPTVLNLGNATHIGQRKVILITGYSASYSLQVALTAASWTGGSGTITFSGVGSMVHLVWVQSAWWVIGAYNASYS